MFPYRLRDPAYGGKLARPPNENNNPYAAGGPIERAIVADLEELRRDYLPVTLSQSLDDHQPKGLAFRAFKDVFGKAKASLLHTRVAPPRCDSDAYSQLMYGACFDLFDESKSLEEAGFALFCLYAFYETHPLIGADPTPGTVLSMVPMGLRSRENPSVPFRRSFRGPIRVDHLHYGRLCQMRDLTLARRSRCQAARMLHLGGTNGEGTGTTTTWTCRCAIATDTICILNRLTDHFEYCSYTGPFGLEALACHPAFCAHWPVQTDQEVDESVLRGEQSDEQSDLATVSGDLEVHFGAYAAALGAVRWDVEETRRSRRVRAALEPIFKHSRDVLTLPKLMGGVQQKTKVRRVTFAEARSDGQGLDLMSVDEADVPSSPRERVSGPDTGQRAVGIHELVLPLGLTELQERSVQVAVERILARNQLATRPAGQYASDEISAPSVASAVSGVGRSALEALLTHAGAVSFAANGGAQSGEAFLHTGQLMAPNEQAISRSSMDGNLSELSSDEDDVSFAAAAVGRSSIRDLVQGDGETENGPTRKRQRRTPKKTGISSPRRDELPVGKSDDESFTVASCRGRLALEQLLAATHR